MQEGDGKQRHTTYHLHCNQGKAHAKPIGDPAGRDADERSPGIEECSQPAELLTGQMQRSAQERGQSTHAEGRYRPYKHGQERQAEDDTAVVLSA
jgi:hypothetical protein